MNKTLSRIFGGVLNMTLVQLIIFFFIPWHVPLKSVYKHLSVEACVVLEIIQLIYKADDLTNLCMGQVFAGVISKQTIVQFYSWKQPSKSVLLF